MSDLDRSESRKRRSLRPQSHEPDPLTCPRCESTNTKFCYYNNYNKTQPRYFCKACKRHWTKGGILRNVPVGGGRKNKRLRCPDISATTAIRNNNNSNNNSNSNSNSNSNNDKMSIDQHSLVNEPKETLKELLFEPVDEESISYTDIEELQDLGRWDFDGSMMMMMMADCDEERSNLLEVSSSLKLEDLDSMVLEDVKQPWEDPSFEI